jgi:signal peptidase II
MAAPASGAGGAWLPFFLCAPFLLLDQITKVWVMRNLTLADHIVVIPRVFDLIHTRNPGAAWGMFGRHPHWLAALSLVMLILLVVFRRHILEDTRAHRVAYGLLLAGIIGNLIDRVKYGAVVDFLDFHIIRFPTFNVADMCITGGVAVYILFSRPSKAKPAPSSSADAPAV